MEKYAVKYRVTGHTGSEPNGEFVDPSGPYDSFAIAEEHRQDIRSFEGVEYAYVVPLSE